MISHGFLSFFLRYFCRSYIHFYLFSATYTSTLSFLSFFSSLSFSFLDCSSTGSEIPPCQVDFVSIYGAGVRSTWVEVGGNFLTWTFDGKLIMILFLMYRILQRFPEYLRDFKDIR